MIKIKFEDIGSCGTATNNIPTKVSYGKNNNKNEIYYFGNPPKKPKTLSDYIKNKKRKGD